MTLFEIPVFEGTSLTGLALLVTLYAFAFTVKGVFGYGAVAPIIVFGSMIIGPHHAVLLASLSNMFTHIQFVRGGLKDGDRRLAFRMTLLYLPTIIVGVWVFGHLDAMWLKLIVGILIFIFVGAEALNLIKRFEGTIRKHSAWFGVPLAAGSGVIAGMIGAGGVLLVSVYVKIIRPDKNIFRGTMITLVSCIIGWRMTMLGVNGFITSSLLVESICLLPISIGASLLGTHIFKRLTDQRFFVAFQIMLICASVILIIQTLTQIFSTG